MSENRRSPNIVGAMTVVTVLLVLCMTVFAVLTLVSAKADLRISRKNADTVQAYYDADTRAATLTADFAARLADGDDAAASGEALAAEAPDCAVEVAVEDGVPVLTASVPVDARRTLDIRVRFGETPEYERWQLSGAEDSGATIEDDLPVWQG